MLIAGMNNGNLKIIKDISIHYNTNISFKMLLIL